MTETNPLNTQLETTNITWNLDDLYTSTEAPEINQDISWCETEAIAIREAYYQKNGCSVRRGLPSSCLQN